MDGTGEDGGAGAEAARRPFVRVGVEAGVATVTLDSPANRNALSRALLADLHAALDRAEQPDVRVIVVTHTGTTFCAGVDLKERSAGQVDSSPMTDALRRLMEARQPSIAAVRGAVRAGGIGLMAACDLVVVDPQVTFAFTEVRIGVAPAIISVPILRRCAASHIAASFLTGEAFDGPAAQAIGLVTHVDADVDGVTRRLVDGVLQGAPNAVAATKHLLRGGGSWAEMQQLSEALFASDEAVEGMRAFAERRAPSWTVRPKAE